MALAKKIWLCVNCGEQVPANFGCCWNCGTDEQGRPDPNFEAQDEPITAIPHRVNPMMQWIGFVLWTLFCGFLVLMAWMLDQWLPAVWSQRIAGILALYLVGVLAGVAVNILAIAYPALVGYFFPIQEPLVQLGDMTRRDRSDHESTSGL